MTAQSTERSIPTASNIAGDDVGGALTVEQFVSTAKSWRATRFERDDDSGDRTELIPSRLDASVLFAHGTGTEAERSIADVEEQLSGSKSASRIETSSVSDEVYSNHPFCKGRSGAAFY